MNQSVCLIVLASASFFTMVDCPQAAPGEPEAAKSIALHKPRIINTTDLGADPDDEQSMVRQLVCANEFDIEGLIVSTGCWKKNQSNTKMLDKIVDAYGEVVDQSPSSCRRLSHA